MVRVSGLGSATATLKTSLIRTGLRLAVVVVALALFYGSCVARVRPNEYGVEQRQFGFHKGIVERAFGPGLYFVGRA
jgi:hypothetical protein